MQSIEKAIATGMAVILQNVDEELDSNIDPILKKSLKKIAGKLMIILGDKEILSPIPSINLKSRPKSPWSTSLSRKKVWKNSWLRKSLGKWRTTSKRPELTLFKEEAKTKINSSSSTTRS
jgi:hypothetical protein